MDAHARLFHRIAPVYRWFFHAQTRAYSGLLERYSRHLPQGGKVLDIGCGPGAFSNALHKSGFEVTGADFAPAMIEHARKLSREVTFIVADGRNLPFPDKSFALVTAAFVAHGLKPEGRLNLYSEAARLAREKVIFHDYNLRRNILVSLVERLEGGNYFSFIENAEEEMGRVFPDVQVVEVGPRANWYICTPANSRSK